MGLDWDLPPYPPAPSDIVKPLRVEVLPAEPLPPSRELDADAHFERALLLVQLRHYGLASTEITESRALNPGLSRWDELVGAYSQVIERHPRDVEAYSRRAQAYELLEQWEKATADYSQVIKLAPQAVGYRISRGRLFFRLGQREKAAEDFRKASEANPHMAHPLARELATSPDPSSQHPSLAIDLVKRAMQQEPGETAYWNTLGIAHYRAGNWEGALAALQKSIELRKPGNAYDEFFLAMTHWQLGNKAEARKWYDSAVRWMDKNQSGNIELRRFRAEASELLELKEKKEDG
jgi:tetratricopeptide (TPR) repeat protein